MSTLLYTQTLHGTAPYTYIGGFGVNVGIYGIHGASGIGLERVQSLRFPEVRIETKTDAQGLTKGAKNMEGTRTCKQNLQPFAPGRITRCREDVPLTRGGF